MPQPFKHPTTHVYYFRKKVPKGLVEVLACREYKRSLGTKDLAEAKVRFARKRSLVSRARNSKARPMA